MDRMTMNDAMDEVFNARNAPRALDDSDRNILADLAHEGDEECAWCHEGISPSLRGGGFNIEEYWEFTLDTDGEIPVHEECLDEARAASEEVRAEAIATRGFR